MTEKAFRQLNIDPEFKNLIRPLRREEYRQLELNLVMEGCREDIIAWNDTIVDGHNRYEMPTPPVDQQTLHTGVLPDTQAAGAELRRQTWTRQELDRKVKVPACPHMKTSLHS